jgi:hypothetical protein
MQARVNHGYTWKQVRNKREALTMACALDYLMEGKIKDATEILGCRLQAVLHADAQGKWTVAQYLESNVTQDTGSRINADAIKNAMHVASLYARAGDFERKRGGHDVNLEGDEFLGRR